MLSPNSIGDPEALAGGDPMQHLFKDIVQEEFDFDHLPGQQDLPGQGAEMSAVDEAIRTSMN